MTGSPARVYELYVFVYTTRHRHVWASLQQPQYSYVLVLRTPLAVEVDAD